MELNNVIITKRMRFNKIVSVFPESIEIFKALKMDAVGCCTLPMDPLEDLMKKEGFSDQDIDQALTDINELKDQKALENSRKPEQSDYKLEEIQEGNKKYHKIGGLLFTDSAVHNVHNLADKAGLKIRLEAGGCSGYKYQFDFAETPEESEYTFALSEKLKLFLDQFTYSKLYGSVVDFKIGLHDSGLQIHNPNLKNSCSCGVSFNF